MTEMIKKLDGLTPDLLYYWERQGYIRPKRKKIGKKSVRDYSNRDFELIEVMFKFYKKGLKPKLCREKAIEEVQRKHSILEEQKRELFKIFKENDISMIGPAKVFEKSDDIEVLDALIKIFKKFKS